MQIRVIVRSSSWTTLFVSVVCAIVGSSSADASRREGLVVRDADVTADAVAVVGVTSSTQPIDCVFVTMRPHQRDAVDGAECGRSVARPCESMVILLVR